MSLLIIVLVVLASARITRLMVDDSITQPVRDWFQFEAAKARETESFHLFWLDFLYRLTDCTWCSSVWAAAGVVGFAATLPWAWFAWPALALSASYLVGLLGLVEIWFEENSGHFHEAD